MKLILTVILIIINSLPQKETLKAMKLTGYKLSYNKEKYNNLKKYHETLKFIKLHEGFSATVYDDNGWKCVGHGQRIAFFKHYKIKDSISIEEADTILRLSFNDHINMVNQVYQGLNYFQSLAVAHMSYGIGIGTLLKGKYLYKTPEGWKININSLYFYRKTDSEKNYKQNRFFEYKLFNYKI
jgi:GH24 family phage-related lysozyme (muramidase)